MALSPSYGHWGGTGYRERAETRQTGGLKRTKKVLAWKGVD